MSSTLNSTLSQAYGLIEADQLDEAVKLLKPVLAENPNNPDAWWLYAHAVENVDDARAALQTVLALDPNYPEANRLLEMLDEATKGLDTGNPLNDISLQPIRTISDSELMQQGVLPPRPAVERVQRDEFDEPEMPTAGRAPGFPWRNIALLAALFLCAIIAAFVIGSGMFTSGTATSTTAPGADLTATSVILQATAAAVQTTPSTAIDPAALTATAIIAGAGGGAAQAAASPTPEFLNVQPFDVSALAQAFQAAGDQTEVTVEPSARGNTLFIALCSGQPNVSLRDTLRRAVDVLGTRPEITDPQIAAVTFRLVDCQGSRRILRSLTAEASDVVEYANRTIDAAAFEARLTAD